jgi:hypothetical protein
MNKHAILSPSGFKALMLCAGKPAMEMGLPDESSEYADEGTAAHFLGSTCLELGLRAHDFKDHKIFVSEDFTGWLDETPKNLEGRTFKVADEMVEAVQTYIDTVHAKMEGYRLLGATVELFVEQAVPIGHITGEEGAEGTSDVVIIAAFPDGRVIVDVGDLKYGKGVEVDAEDNPQPQLYGLGTMEKFGLVYDFTEVVTWISQPRIKATPSEATHTVDGISDWATQVATPAANQATAVILLHQAGDDITAYLTPNEESCRFCKAKATCPKLEAHVKGALDAEFTDLTTADAVGKEEIIKTLVESVPVDLLGAKMDAVALIEDWCKAIRGRVETQLLAGSPVAGYKLVQGKQGNRAWADADDAEKLMKSMRIKKDEMYDLKLISPTTAEKILKDSPKRWKKVLPLIARSDGKPSVAPVSDKRPALEIKPVESEFTVIAEHCAGPNSTAIGADDFI